MSHYSLGVIIPNGADMDVEAIEKYLNTAMAPYDEQGGGDKWDWYEIGGRYRNMLMLSDDSFVNFAPMRNIRWKKEEFSNIVTRRLKRRYDFLCGKISELDDNDEYIRLYSPEYYQELYPTFDAFLEDKKYWFRPYALLTEKYGWEARGECGWFGCSSETSESRKKFYETFNKRIEESDPHDMFVIVDCHI